MPRNDTAAIDLKIAYIGGGSREWARKLMIDLALCPELTGQVALYDIDAESAQLDEQLGNWLQGQPGVVSRWHYASVPTLHEALAGADFVVLSIQPGTLECMGEEIAIAERHGMFFPVGDTASAPGLMRPYTQEEVESWHDWFHCVHQVKFALFQRWGVLPAAGDRHLVEFLPGFARSPEELFRWAIIRTPISYRLERWRVAPQQTRDRVAGRLPLALDPSGQDGVAPIRALLGLGDVVTNVNLENRGQVADLPLHAVVGTNARFSRDEVRPPAAGALPLAVQSLVARHVADQEMIVEAALTGDRDLAFQAVFNDPANRLPVDESWQMFNELLRAGRVPARLGCGLMNA